MYGTGRLAPLPGIPHIRVRQVRAARPAVPAVRVQDQAGVVPAAQVQDRAVVDQAMMVRAVRVQDRAGAVRAVQVPVDLVEAAPVVLVQVDKVGVVPQAAEAEIDLRSKVD